jgi:hypothetical protein
VIGRDLLDRLELPDYSSHAPASLPDVGALH